MEDQLYIIGSDIELMVGPYMVAPWTNTFRVSTLFQTDIESHATKFLFSWSLPFFIKETERQK